MWETASLRNCSITRDGSIPNRSALRVDRTVCDEDQNFHVDDPRYSITSLSSSVSINIV